MASCWVLRERDTVCDRHAEASSAGRRDRPGGRKTAPRGRGQPGAAAFTSAVTGTAALAPPVLFAMAACHAVNFSVYWSFAWCIAELASCSILQLPVVRSLSERACRRQYLQRCLVGPEFPFLVSSPHFMHFSREVLICNLLISPL